MTTTIRIAKRQTMGQQIEEQVVRAAQAGDEAAFGRLVDAHRRELRAHCYRMSGSLAEADDLVQESLLRAWRGLPGFEGRASVRSWLYRVATNTCLDALSSRQARSLPWQLGVAARDPLAPIAPRGDLPWLEPCPDEFEAAHAPSPEAAMSSRQSVALAFLVALQTLPPRQRAVLILRDVVGMEASECAAVLDMSVAAVNSALQRARETTGKARLDDSDEDRGGSEALGEQVKSTLDRYLRAWEQADVGALVQVLRDDATLAMPPFDAWFEGRQAILDSLGGMVLTPEARGRFRLLPARANGCPAFAAYALDEASGRHRFAALHVLALRGGRVAAIDAFLDPSLWARFGVPEEL